MHSKWKGRNKTDFLLQPLLFLVRVLRNRKVVHLENDVASYFAAEEAPLPSCFRFASFTTEDAPDPIVESSTYWSME